jgi:hypothetical protein
VTDIEDAGTRADCHVLRRDAGVLDGHVPAGKGHHAGVRGKVSGVKRCFEERGGSGQEIDFIG